MLRIRTLIAAAISLCLSFVTFSPASACSGGDDPITLNMLVEAADVFIWGTIVEVDDLAINAVIRVSEYLKGGSGPEYIVYQRADTALMSAHYRFGFDTGCLYGGPGRTAVGLSGYFSLIRYPSGVYTHTSLYGDAIDIDYAPIHIRTDPQGEDSDFVEVDNPVDVGQFRAWVAEFSGETPARPVETSGTWIAPLSVTTATGQSYLIPIDGGPVNEFQPNTLLSAGPANTYPHIFEDPPICRDLGCRILSPDGVFHVEVLPDATLSVDYAYSRFGASSSGVAWTPLTLPGEAVSMSPTGRGLAVWLADTLNVYRLGSTGCDCMYAGYAPSIEEIASIALTSAPVETRRHIRWSGDGAILTFSDLDGLWAVDLLRDAEPALIVPSSDESAPIPLHVSQRGRYVSFRTAPDTRQWVMLDRLTGSTYPNMLPSPSETVFAYFGGGETPPPESLTRWPCLMCAVIDEIETPLFVWFEQDGSDWAWSVNCGPGTPYNGCIVSSFAFDSRLYGQPSDNSRSYRFPAIRDFSYEPHRNLFAVVTADRRIQVGDQEIDLSGLIDSDIVDINWLRPSLFYWE